VNAPVFDFAEISCDANAAVSPTASNAECTPIEIHAATKSWCNPGLALVLVSEQGQISR